MTARRRHGMRRLIDTTIDLVCAGDISPNEAAQKLLESGVPVAVIGRVVSSAINAKSSPPPTTATDASAVVEREQVRRPASA